MPYAVVSIPGNEIHYTAGTADPSLFWPLDSFAPVEANCTSRAVSWTSIGEYSVDLAEGRPSFFDYLDSDPERAAREFYEWAMRYFTACPPSVVSAIPRESRATVFHDIVVDCILDDFRVLRRYEDRGRPFAAWFLFVTRNRILDRIRSIKKTPDQAHRDSDGSSQRDLNERWEPVTEEHPTLKRILEVVDACLSQMTEQCQILLRMTAEETSIPEILEQRLIEASDNKKMSNAIRYCQKRLRDCVKAKGVEISQIL